MTSRGAREHRPVVLTGEQPAPHATAADAAASVDLVERYGAMAAGIGWTRGVLDQAGLLARLTAVDDLRRRRHPNAEFITSILTGPPLAKCE